MKARQLLYTTFLVVLLTLTITSGVLAEGETWLDSPVAGASRCGADFAKSNPLGKQEFHNAVDMACGMGGAPVLAVASGKVVWTDWWPINYGGPETGHGRTVIVFHPETNLYTYYAHLNDMTVSVDQQVGKGTIVGHVGNSGYVQKTEPDPKRGIEGNPNNHLHFAVRNTGPEDGACWDLSCWKNPDDYLGKAPSGDQVNQSEESNGDGEEGSDDKEEGEEEIVTSGLLGTLDRIALAIRPVPSLKKYAEFWDKVRGYLSWAVAILIVLLFFTVLRPLVNWLAKSKWGKKRNRKKKEFFFLSLILLIIYESGSASQELILLLFNCTFGIWLFFAITGLINKLWRHFNYDPDLEEILAHGGVDKWEWLREIILTPVIYGVLISILAFTFGYFWTRPSPIVAQDTPVASSPSQQEEEEPSPEQPPENKPQSPKATSNSLHLSCDFNPIEAGLGPVKVSCDENGLPSFPIRWWNGEYFDFHIPLDIWEAVNLSGATPKGMIGIFAFGSSESTGFTNYKEENPYHALGTWQFIPGTYSHWAPEGFEDPSYRTNIVIAAKAVANMQRDGMREIYNMTDQAEVESCFQGGSGCNTWNHHAGQANYVWRLMVALRVAAGLN